MSVNGPQVDLSFLRERAVLKRVAAVTAAFVVTGGAYALLAPKWYTSVLTVVPARGQKSGLSAVFGGVDLGGLAGLDTAVGGADAPRIAAVLQSVAVTDAVVEKFDLRARYGAKYQETAREGLWRHCSVVTLPKPNLVELACEDKDPRFVQAMVAYFADYGNQVFRRVGGSSASEEVRFLEKRVAELRQHADDTAVRMRTFQEEHRVVDLDSQAKAVISNMAALNAQRITKQLELDYARTFSASDEATTRQLRSQLSVVGERLRELEEPPGEGSVADKGSASGAAAAKVFPPALSVPKLRAELEKLYRDRKVAEATLVFALERLEAAKANEARDVSTFLVLDPPTLPTRPSRPKRLTSVAVALLLGLAFSLVYEFVRAAGGLGAVLTASGFADRPTSGKHSHAANG